MTLSFIKLLAFLLCIGLGLRVPYVHAEIDPSQLNRILKKTKKTREANPPDPKQGKSSKSQRTSSERADKEAQKPLKVTTATLIFKEGGFVKDFGAFMIGQDSEHTIEVENIGERSANKLAPILLRTPFTYLGGSYPGKGGTCGRVLPAGKGCRIRVHFVARKPGVSTVDFSLSYLSGEQELSTSIRLVARTKKPGRLSIVEGHEFPQMVVGQR